MLPKIIFRRSKLYDQLLKRRKGFVMPPDIIFDKFIKKLETKWNRINLKILQEISKATKLKWHEKEIVCYISSGVAPYSDPLTLNLKSDIHTLIHELIHRILSEPENKNKIKKNWSNLMAKYKKESQKTKTHIVVYAVQAYIMEKYFSKKEFKKTIKQAPNKEYALAWRIVLNEGYKNIIKTLTKGLERKDRRLTN